MNLLVFLIVILITLLPSSMLDVITDYGTSFSKTPAFTRTIDSIIEHTGLVGFAFLCLLLYVLGLAWLPVLRDHPTHIPVLESTIGDIMNILSPQTFLSALDYMITAFMSFGFGVLITHHHDLVFRLLFNIYQSVRSIKTSRMIDYFLCVAKSAWTVIDNSVLLLGCLYELSRLRGDALCLLVLSPLAIIFTISTCVLIHAVASFIIELAYFLVLEFKKTCFSTYGFSKVSAFADECFQFVYMYDGEIEIKASDLPTPHKTLKSVANTAVPIPHHVRAASCGSSISNATQGSTRPSKKISGKNSSISTKSKDSTSANVSGHSTDESRPTSRSSQPTTVSDLDQCIQIVDSCMDRIRQLETENQTLNENGTYLIELELENQMLRMRDEHSRRNIIQYEENFQGLVKGFEFLEAANAELRLQKEVYRQELAQQEDRFETRFKEFVRNFHPEHIDIFSDSDQSSPSSQWSLPITPKVSANPTSSHASVQSPVNHVPILPETPSSGPSLPFSPRTPAARSRGHISPTSLIKPLHPKTPTGPGLPSPEAMKREFNPRVKIVVPRCPTTVSSNNSLPCPTTVSTNSSYAFEFDETTTRSPISSPHSLKKRYPNGIPLFPAGPGLPCPMRLVFGDRIPLETSPSLPSSDDTPLPCPTPISTPSSFGSVSINSLNRPYFGGRVDSPLANRRKVNSFSPLSNGDMHVDPITSINRPRYKTPAARARAQRFSSFRDFESSPSIASSTGPPLPAPSPRPSDASSDYDPFV